MTLAPRLRPILALALLAPALAACPVAAPVPTEQNYRLAVPAVQAMARPAISGTLIVERPSNDDVLNDRAMAWSSAHSRAVVETYSYHVWAEAPARLVQGSLARYLRAANVATMAASSDLRVRPDVVLAGQLLRFERVMEAGPKPLASVALELRYEDARNDRLLWLKTYEAEKPAADDSMPATIAAFDAALADIYYRILTDLAATPLAAR